MRLSTSLQCSTHSELLPGVHQLILASTGLWSLPLAGSTQELSGSTPLTRIWSIRTTGKDAGQVKPKPSLPSPGPIASAR
jgi:hypothetical protein